MNILLIDKRVSRYKDIVAAIDPALAVGIVFDYFKDTFATLKTRIEALGLLTTGNSVGLIQHNYKAPMFSMLASADLMLVAQVAARDPELAAWAQFKDFIAWCKTELNTAYFDMMACALYSNPDWKHVIDTLPGQTGVTVRASTDNTGSATLGGDWFLESHTGVNLKTVYFTELIEEYRGVLYLESHDIREYSTKGFAIGSVVAWGDSSGGGAAPDIFQAGNVVAVYSTAHAFAALKTDGSVVVWGDSNSGGTDPGITGDVVAVYSTYYAFAALKTDGSIVVWGDSSDPGITGGVVSIYSTRYAFAALKSDGSVVAWGDVEWLTHGIVAVYSNEGAFAALKSDGSVVAWGDVYSGGVAPYSVSDENSGVVAVCSSTTSFAALKNDGSVEFWGVTSGSVSSGVIAVYSNTDNVFVALKSDGGIITWGTGYYSGGVDPGITGGVVSVCSNYYSFAALKYDGRVVAWEYSSGGGLAPNSVTDEGSDVVAIYSTSYAFAALKSDGSVVAWGDAEFGGTTPDNVSSGVVAVYSTIYAFAALKADGSVVVWGSSDASWPTPDNVGSGVVAVYSTETAFAALKTTATTFNLSAAHYRDMDRYNTLRKKENRRRVNLTTLNNNVFTLSAAQDLQMFNPAIPSDKTLRIIVPDYVASSYSITSTATIPSDAGSFIVACDEGEPVTISGTTYVNYGSYIYKRETDNTYTKLTSATINDTLYTLYGGDGINSSGIGLVLATSTPTSHWVSGIEQPYALAAYGSYMYVGRRGTGLGIDRYDLSGGSLDTEHWVDGGASNMFNIASMAADSSYLYVVASATAENPPEDPTNIFKISLADASIASSDWAPEVALVGNIAIYGAFMYAVHYSDGVIRKLSLADGSVANANFATVSVVGDTQNIIMNIDDAGEYMYVQRGLGRISKLALSTGTLLNNDRINISPVAPSTFQLDGFVLYGQSIYATNLINGNIVHIHLWSAALTDAAWATSAGWVAETSYMSMTIFGSSLYAARADTGTIDKFTLPAVSNICFPASAPVQTDQGIVAIAQLDTAVHTIEGMCIVDVTKTVTNDSFLVCIGRDALGKDYPVQDTVISRLHKLEYGGRMVEAEWFVNRVAGVERIPYSGETLYNVILAEPRTMRVNNLVCETLLPSNPIAKLYARSSRYTEYTRDIVLSLLKTHKANNNREAYRKVLSSL